MFTSKITKVSPVKELKELLENPSQAKINSKLMKKFLSKIRERRESFPNHMKEAFKTLEETTLITSLVAERWECIRRHKLI